MLQGSSQQGAAVQIVITYEEGPGEVVQARLEGDLVAVNQRWVPGILTDEPERCYFKSDYFLCAINEGNEREGTVRPEPGDIDPETGKPAWVGFTWKLLGTETDECRRKMARWINRIGGSFDPERAGADHVYAELLHILGTEETTEYDRDRQCWATYLGDLRSEAATLLRDAGLEPSEDWAANLGVKP